MSAGPDPPRIETTSDEPLNRARPRFFYGWTIVGTTVLVSFGQVAFFNPVAGVFQPTLNEAFGWSRAEIAGAVTLGSLAGALTAPFFGVAIDRYGARWVVAAPALVITVVLVLLAEVSELWQFYLLFAIGRGLAMAAIGAATVVAISNWFVRRRPFAVALGTLGIRGGTAVLPLLVVAVIAARGWPDGFRVLALVTLLVAVAPPLLFLRRRPEDMGLRPDGDPAPPRPGERPAPSSRGEEDWTLREALRTRAYWLVGLAFSLTVFGNGTVNFHQFQHLVDQGLGGTGAALIATVVSLAAGGGALLGGAIATRYRARWTMLGALPLQAGAVVLLTLTGSMPVALLYAVWFGLFQGATVTMLHVIYADYFGRRQLGLIRGSFQPIALSFNAAGPLVVGLWFDRTGSYDGPFTLIAVLFLASAVAFGLAAYPARPRPPAPSGTGPR